MSCHSNKCCDPCPPCETQFPETCEALPSTNDAINFVVEDSAFCKKTITGEEGQIPRITGGLIDFVDASSNADPNTLVARDSLGGADFARIDATELHVNNPVGDTRIELGGAGNVYMDLKNPNSDDYDLRIQASGTDPRILTNAAKLLVDGTVVALQSVSSGNVGIGTDAPSNKLDVIETQSGQTAVRAQNPSSGAGSSAGFIAQQGSVTGNFLANANSEITIGSTTASPFILKSNNTNQVYLTSAGDVGVGIAAPQAKFHAQNNSASDTVRITQLGAGAALRIEDQPTETTPFIVDGSGNVGIGTDTPSEKLHVVGNAYISNNLEIDGNIDINGNVIISDKIVHSGDTDTAIRFPANDTVTIETSGSEKVRITSSGDVGIGTATPSHKLHVVGGIRSTTDTNGIGYGTGAGGAATVTGTGTGQTVTINKICGTITCASAAGSTTRKAVVVTNSTVGEFDTVIISGKGGANAYEATVFNVKTGEFSFQYNSPTGTGTETPLFNFAVIKSVNA